MANVIVPWPGPVPEPGASNVMIVGAARSKSVLLKLCKPSIEPPDALVAGVAGARLAASTVCDSAKQAKRSGTSRKMPPNGEYLIGPLTQGIIVDLRCMNCFICFVSVDGNSCFPLQTDSGARAARNLNFSRCLLFFLRA